jgi:ABC-2 type transport system ATP-binding protein
VDRDPEQASVAPESPAAPEAPSALPPVPAEPAVAADAAEPPTAPKRPARAKAATGDAASPERPARAKAVATRAGAAKAATAKAPAAKPGSGSTAAKRTTGAAKAGTAASRAGAAPGEAPPKRTSTRAPARRIAAADQAADTVRDRSGKAGAARPAPAAAAGEVEETRTEQLPPAEEGPTRELQPTLQSEPAVAAADRTTELLAVPDDEPTTLLPVAEQAPPPAAAASDSSTARFKTRPVLKIEGLAKRFGPTLAVAGIDLTVQPGSFYGIVGPNGAGKTTTLSMITGLLRPDAGSVHVHGIDVWKEPERAKRAIGVLPDALRLFDRLSGAQLLHYSGVLRGLDAATVRQRSADLVQAFGLEDATGRLVADYSAGMTKKIALACAMIHSPRLLVLDEPFESVDPVSAANIVEILQRYVRAGGTVVLSSHGMDLIQRVCDHVAIIIDGQVLAAGTVDEVRGEQSLEDRFVDLAGGRKAAEGLEWLHSFSD